MYFSWYNSRVEQKVIQLTLENTYQIEYLSHEKRFEKMVELGLKANSCNPFWESSVRLLYLLVEWKSALFLELATELGKQIIIFFFLLCFFFQFGLQIIVFFLLCTCEAYQNTTSKSLRCNNEIFEVSKIFSRSRHNILRKDND
jgi:hypothetical protein